MASGPRAPALRAPTRLGLDIDGRRGPGATRGAGHAGEDTAMRLRRITLAMVMHSWRPHSRWPRERLKAAFGGRRSLTSLEVLGLDVPAHDRLWAVLREEIVPARELRLIACWCADRALSRERAAGCEPDTRSWWAAAVARRL